MVFSRVRSARYDDRVAEIIRDRHLEERLLFKDTEQRISAWSSPSRQRSFDSPLCLFSPPYFDTNGVRSLIQNPLCRYIMTMLLDPNQSSIIRSIEEGKGIEHNTIENSFFQRVFILETPAGRIVISSNCCKRSQK